MNTQTIHARNTTCKCGCGGLDSMHAPRFKRSVRSVRPINAEVETAWGWRVKARALGEVKFPWGTETVADTLAHGWVRLSIECRARLLTTTEG
jgi:hypothetical protein